jgi:hypothetical protein
MNALLSCLILIIDECIDFSLGCSFTGDESQLEKIGKTDLNLYFYTLH